MEDGQSALLQQFCDITGVDDVGSAVSVLEATNWNLEEAINLQFATGGLGAGGGGGGPAPAAEAAGAAGGNAAAGSPMFDGGGDEEEHVRAPLPVMRDRLYGDAGGLHGIRPRQARYGASPADRGPTHIDVFQDHGAPDSSGAAGGNGAGGSSGVPALAPGAGAASSGAAASNSQRLSDLFKPPAGLLFEGDFEAAKALAGGQARWLLVNVQSPEEFASHRLNRDTWSQGLVQDMLRESFVFWQVYNSAAQGEAVIRAYHLEELPACLIIDPITGAKLWERTGFVSADALVEELVPFMDAGPNDPGAAALAQRFYAQSAKRRNRGSAASGPASGGGGPGGGMTEDEQLAMAIAMSVEGPGAAAAGPAGAHQEAESEDMDEEAVWKLIREKEAQEAAAKAAAAAGTSSSGAPAPSAAAAAGSSSRAAASSQPAAAPAPATQPAATAAAPEAAAAAAVDVDAVQAAAAARLPPQPAAGAAGSCRVAFRLPDGSRVQRTFLTTDTVAVLQDYVVSVSKEAAASPSFTLAEAGPGSTPLADAAATLEAAGVAGAMLVLRGC